MTAGAFTPSRPDGRSDRQVVFDLVGDSEPDTLFTQDEIITALQDGLPREVSIDRARMYRAVAQGNSTLLRERKRYLRVSRGRGYRVMHTSEAVAVALDRKATAQTHLRRGLEVLREARLDELDHAQRLLHEGQLLIMAGLFDAVRQSERRHERSEQLIAELTTRVERVEQRDTE